MGLLILFQCFCWYFRRRFSDLLHCLQRCNDKLIPALNVLFEIPRTPVIKALSGFGAELAGRNKLSQIWISLPVCTKIGQDGILNGQSQRESDSVQMLKRAPLCEPHADALGNGGIHVLRRGKS